jgi:hypothetical protein
MHKPIIRLVATAALLVVLWHAQALSETLISNLEPEEGVFGFRMHNAYFQAVGERLLSSTQYRKCQLVFLPSFSEESAVYVKYDNDNKTAPPIVVSVKFERQLWNAMHTQSNEPSQIKLSVNRLEAPIDPRIALVLERAWSAMLSRVRYPEKVVLGLDGESYHFANFELGVGYRTGKVWSPDEGTLAYDLVAIGKSLRKYPSLLEIERNAAAQILLSNAQALLTRLNGTK